MSFVQNFLSLINYFYIKICVFVSITRTVIHNMIINLNKLHASNCYGLRNVIT